MARSVEVKPEELGRLLTVPEPWLMSEQGIDFLTGSDWQRLGMIEAQFPEAVPGDSGRQFWRLTELGRAVARGEG